MSKKRIPVSNRLKANYCKFPSPTNSMQGRELPFKEKWTVASRLRLLSIMIVVSAIFAAAGAIEITKWAKTHELNMLHLKHNYLFSNELRSFRDSEDQPVDEVRYELVLVR